MNALQLFVRFIRAGVSAGILIVVAWGLASVTHDVFVPAKLNAQAVLIPPPPVAWTAVGASGSVDESSIQTFGFTGASAGYGANASIAPQEFRYNVVNTHHRVSSAGATPNVAQPGWTQLEFGAQAPFTSTADAYLYRVNKCTGQQQVVCWVRHQGTPVPGACKKCEFAASTFDFSQNLYYVRVVTDRNTPGELPMAHTLRIY